MEDFQRFYRKNNNSELFSFQEKGKQHRVEIQALFYTQAASILFMRMNEKSELLTFHLEWEKN